MSKPRGWTVEVSRKQLQNSALYSVDRSKVVEVDLDAVETQVQKTLCESDTTISDFETTELSKETRERSNISFGDHNRRVQSDVDKIEQYPDAYPYDTNPVISPLEHDKKRLQAWMSSTTMAISQNVKSLVNVQRKLLEKSAVWVNPECSPNLSPITENSSEIPPAEPKTLDLQTLVKPTSKPTKCYLDFSEMSTTPSGALSSLDPFVIGKAMDVMKAMNDTDWDKVKHLYEMFRRAGRLDQLIIYEFAIKILVNTRGKSGVVDVLRDIDGDLAEAAFRFGKTLLSLYHGSYLLSEGSEGKKHDKRDDKNSYSFGNEEFRKKTPSPNRGAQIPENVRKSFEIPKKEKEPGPKRTSYAYLFKDAAAQQKSSKKSGGNSIRKCPVSPYKKCTNRRTSPNTKPFIKPTNPKYAHVKSRYREAAAKIVSQPATAVPKKFFKKPITAAPPSAVFRRLFAKENSKVISKPSQLTGANSFDNTPPTPKGTPLSSSLSTPDSNMDTTTMSFKDLANSKADDTDKDVLTLDRSESRGLIDDKDIVITLERTESRGLIENLKTFSKHGKSEDQILARFDRMTAKAQLFKQEIDDEANYEENKSVESYYTEQGPTGDHMTKYKKKVIEEISSPQDKGDTNSKMLLRKSKSEPKLPEKSESNETYFLVSDHDGSESNFSVKTLYKQLPNLRPFIIDRLLMNVLLAYLLAVTGGALCADDSNSLYCTLSLTLKGKLRTMLIRALHLVDDF